MRKAALARVVGTSTEWYDFFLYNTAAAIVSKDVFAAISGHWGDRPGRKATLITTPLLMGVSSALIGVPPGTESIGIAAPVPAESYA